MLQHKGQSAAMNIADIYEDIIERLDYLVSFSSQLIFVEGANGQDKTQILETYLETRTANAKVVYLRPGANQSPSQQRELLIRQIVPDVHIEPNKSLQDIVFKMLGNEHAQLIIAVDNAHNLPQQLTQELWDLILQNHFAQSHQINVLLSAEDSWSNAVRPTLPGNASLKPINVHVPDSRTPDQVWAEQVARQKREQLELVNQQVPASQSRVSPEASTNLFWLLKLGFGAIIFVAGGLFGLSHLYDIELDSMDEFQSFLTQTSSDKTEQQSALRELMKPGDKISAKQTELVAEAAQPEQQTNSSAEELAGDWQQYQQAETQAALQFEEQQAEPELTPQVSNEEATSSNPVEVSENTIEQPVIEQTAPAQVTAQATEADTESEQQLPPAIPEAVSIDAQTIPSLPFDNEEILRLPASAYTLQLSGMSSIEVLEEFLLEHDLVGRALVYQTQRYGGSWWVVIFGNYPDISTARNAVALLSDKTQALQPWAKSLQAVHDEINQPN